MGSKPETELIKFVWKRNLNYDLSLLYEAESKNPFAFNNQKRVWSEIAEVLQKGPLKMKVTARSCRERVMDLVKKHRKDEGASSRASGITEAEMSEFKKLIVGVSKLEETKPSKQMKNLYSKKGRAEGEAIRLNVLQELQLREEEEIREYENSLDERRPEKSVNLNETKDDADETGKRKSAKPKEKKDDGNESDEDFEFGPSKKSRFDRPNPKKDLLTFLEKKNVNESNIRQEELKIREKEMTNKTTELEIMRMKAESDRLKTEADIEDRKKMTDFFLKLASSSLNTPKE